MEPRELRIWRGSRDLKQWQLAKLLGITQSEVSEYERGRRKPSRLLPRALQGVDAELAKRELEGT